KSGPVAVRVGSPAKTAAVAWTIPAGRTYVLKGASGAFRMFDDTGARTGKPVDGSNRLYATYEGAGAMLASPEAGHTYNRGWVEIDDSQGCGSCAWTLRMIAVVSPRDYLYGLGEVPASWPMEAMEAQADAAR